MAHRACAALAGAGLIAVLGFAAPAASAAVGGTSAPQPDQASQQSAQQPQPSPQQPQGQPQPSQQQPQSPQQPQSQQPTSQSVGVHAALATDGLAVMPAGAPPPVAQMIAAANRIARKPYVWGGGHLRWHSRGYDCSGSVSYILHAAGLLDRPLVSGQLAHWGRPGRGRWVTIYANSHHVWIVIAGLRFDNGHPVPRGTSHWAATSRPAHGFKIRHIFGL